MFEAHDLLPERHECRTRHLETRDAERDPDDRDAQEDPGEEMPESEPPPGEDEPQDVGDGTQALTSSRTRNTA